MRQLLRFSVLLFALGILACTPPVPSIPPSIPPPLPPLSAPEHQGRHIPILPPAPLSEEPLAPPAPAPQEVTPVPPPEASSILAGIDKDTPPQRAASLRLTDQGRKLLESGDLMQALDRLETAIKIDPTNAQGYYWLAQMHYKNKRYDQAIAFADKAAVLFGPSDPAWMSQAYTFKGTVLEQLGRFADAREAYRRAVEAQSGNLAALAGLARLGDGADGTAP